ncbi:MAG: hypothetical protein KQH83_05560 [Actinobacteria bacterium]|nr:hypothetical protein [Actinomycetota bacterium]
MPSFVKKVVKHCSGDLHPGETVEGATFGRPAGTFGRSVAFGAAGVVGAVAAAGTTAKREAGHEGATAEGKAAGFPSGDVVLAVTPMRFLVFGFAQMSGKPKELRAEYPLTEVAGVSQEQRKLHRSLQIRFDDGSLVDLDVVKMARPDDFQAAFERLKGLA